MGRNRQYLLIVSLTFVVTLSQAQVRYSTESKDSTNLYNKSVAELGKYLDKIGYSGKFINIEKGVTSLSLPDHIGRYILISTPENKKGIKHLVRIVPLRVRNNKFYVTLIPFKVDSTKKKNIKLINSGALEVFFEYHSDTSNFSFAGIEGGFPKIQE